MKPWFGLFAALMGLMIFSPSAHAAGPCNIGQAGAT